MKKPEPTVDRQALPESFARLLQSTRVVPWEADAQTWEFTYVGPQAVDLLGYSQDAWYQKDFWLSHIHPDDRDEALNFCLKSSQACRDYEFEYRMISAEGRTVWIHDLVSVEAVQGVPKNLRGFLIDITNRKQLEIDQAATERHLRSFIELAPDAIVAVHSDGRIALVNQQAERVFGYERQEMLDGMAIEQLLPARLRAKHVVHRQGYVAAPNVRPMGKRAMSLVGLRKNGEEFPADINIGPLNTEQGLLTVSVIRDLTEKRRMEAEAGRHREELARVQRVASLGELQAAVAHELNQPLTAVLSNAQAGVRFLDQEPPNISELKEILSDIIDNDRRAAEVIRRIRTLVKRTDVTRESVSVSEQIQRVLSLMQNDLRLKGVAVLFEFEDMPRIVADPVQIQQVVLNLLMNSVEAIAIAKQEAPTVTVSIRRDESTLRVAVEDNGCGIAEADVPRLFESFHTSKPDGLGMGLSICRSIVEAHGGRIWVAGTSRLGTTVSFSLPIDEGGAP